MAFPRIVVSAPKSGSGKTLITIALIKALSMAGKKVCAFKCGPDYIDPMFHRNILGVPSRNLDLFFTDEETTKAIFCGSSKGEISIVEGVMGFYDGLGGIREEASTSHLARVLKAPVVLVIDGKGMSRSVLAEIAGFLSMDEEKSIKAVILNNTSQSIFESLKPEIENRFGIVAAGYFPHQKELSIESRYLGLTLPQEIQDIQKMAEKAALELTKTVDLEALVKLAEAAEDLEYDEKKAPWLFGIDKAAGEKVKIAVAKDDAFCFYYQDNLELLEHFGAEIVEFSPLKDSELPQEVSGILLGGGYPELFVEGLEKNRSMRKSILENMKKGIPVLAECGGFMYLHETIQTAGKKSYRMAGAVKGSCSFTGKLVRFGYAAFSEKTGGESGFGTFLKPVKGHEFHYFDSTSNGSSCVAEKPVSGKVWDCAHVLQNSWLGFAHLYYGSNPEFAKRFVEFCRAYNGGRV